MKSIVVDVEAARLIATQLARRSRLAAPYFGPLSPVRMVDVELPSPPPPGCVRVRNRISSICGSDLHFVLADGDLRIAPAALPGGERHYMGHELVGEVVEVGEGVTQVAVGDRVIQIRAGADCMAQMRPDPCRHCAEGNYNLCEAPPRPDDAPSIGGGWSPEWIGPQGRLYKVPPELTDEQAVLIEPAGSAIRGALRHRPCPGDKVLVIGCGTQGLVTIQALRAVQPDCSVYALARFPYQAEMARKGGAQVIMLGQDLYAEAATITGARLYTGMFGNRTLLGGFDAVYDCVGVPQTLRDALRLTRAGGTVVLIGVYLAPMHIDLTPVWFHEIDLKGVLAHGAEEWDGVRMSTFDVGVRWVLEGKLNFDGFITHRFRLDQYQEALRAAVQQAKSSSIKVVFDFRDTA